MKRNYMIGGILLMLLLFGVGIWIGTLVNRGSQESSAATVSGEKEVKFWTCSMHPQVKNPGPGKCPYCGMDLIPVTDEDGSEDLGPRQLKLSPAAQKLAEVRTATAQRKFVSAEVRMVGKVEYDETQVGYITAWVPGRLDRLYVDYTGVAVNQGDHMVYLYSPELVAAQEELIQAVKSSGELGNSDLTLIKERAAETIRSSRERLRLWGVTQDQIKEIERTGQASDHMTIYAPMSGVVVEKNAREGMYVQTGTRIYTIADLSQVWVKLDAYESDLPWIHYGQQVEFDTEAYPGEVFTGRISFIDPVLNSKTRTVKVRVNVDNREGKLKPEMFVRGLVRSRIASEGKVMDPDLAGKWISPMHPEIVKDQPGECDICGMDLVSADQLGYLPVEATPSDAPLVIPASAPLITGKRAVVYVAVPDKPGVFEGREVVLGPRAGDYYLVKAGLKEGEDVVVHGNFKLDSAIQIQAKPSMMNPEAGGRAPGHDHGEHGESMTHEDSESGTPSTPSPAPGGLDPEAVPSRFRDQLTAVYHAYLELHKALAGDAPDKAASQVDRIAGALAQVDMKSLSDPAHKAWMPQHASLAAAVDQLQAAGSEIEPLRKAFEPLSHALKQSIATFGIAQGESVYAVHCPMAFEGEGGDWLQASKEVSNPYYGARMQRCGKITETLVKE